MGSVDEKIKHPAVYSQKTLDSMIPLLAGYERILDPFAGTGKIHDLVQHGHITVGVELEPEWALMRDNTIIGDATKLPFADSSFDAICTSPCVTPDMRVLTADLRWVPAGDIVVGDRLLAFDEFGRGVTASGNIKRRKFQFCEVLHSSLGMKECARVNLSNGDSLTVTTDHPWLAIESKGYSHVAWIKTEDFVAGRTQVLKQFSTGDRPHSSWDSGWIAGRLLDKIQNGDVSSRTIQPKRITVEAVESIGEQEISGIETSTGTLIVEGYLHHNTYGNRFADHHNPKDKSVRRSYKFDLGRDLHPNNSGAMHWGFDYQRLHLKAWAESFRVLRPGGVFVINLKDHIRGGVKQNVAWHIASLSDLGLRMVAVETLQARGMKYGANRNIRVTDEFLWKFEKVDT